MELSLPPLSLNRFGGYRIIAIMLGRLRMTLQECEDAYLDLSKEIFTPRSQGSWNPLWSTKTFLDVRGRFDSKVLEEAIKKYIQKMNFPDDILLKDDKPECKV